MSKSFYILLLIAVLVTACGGGGGSSSDQSNAPPVVNPPRVTVSAVGVLLSGDPSTLALDTVVDRVGEPPNQDELIDTLISSRLTGVIEPTATVEQINTALSAVGGRITMMISKFPIVDIGIPPVSSEEEAETISQALIDTGAFLFVSPTYFEDPLKVLPPSSSGCCGNGSGFHQIIHSPALWNLRDWILEEGNSINVVVADSFYPSDLNFPSDLDIIFDNGTLEIGTNTLRAFGYQNGNHGYSVSGIIAAQYSDNGAVGVHPVPELVGLKGISLGPDTWTDILSRIRNGLPSSGVTNKFVLNTSIGYEDPVSVTPLRKALEALTWRRLEFDIRSRFIHTTSAGNESIDARTASPFNTNRFYTNPCEILNVLQDQIICEAVRASMIVLQPETASSPSNVLVVGSVDNDLVRSSFSNTNVDISAVGREVLTTCVIKDVICDDDNGSGLWTIIKPLFGGTSAASPEVAAAAATLLTIVPSLDTDQVVKIIKNTSQTANNNSILDVYSAVLSLDVDYPASVRLALLDQNNDAVFDINDFEVFFNSYAASQNNPALGDYSRYDLNGDGNTGGNTTSPFNLDMNYDSLVSRKPIYSVANQLIEGVNRPFNESFLTDLDILCYYAYSPQFKPSDTSKITTSIQSINEHYGTFLDCQSVSQQSLYVLNGIAPTLDNGLSHLEDVEIFVYSMDLTTGALTLNTTVDEEGEWAATSIAIDGSGSFAFVYYAFAAGQQFDIPKARLVVYSIEKNTGELTRVTSVDTAPTSISTVAFSVVVNEATFYNNPPPNESDVVNIGYFKSMAIDPSGQFVYLNTYTSEDSSTPFFPTIAGSILIYHFNQITGDLNLVTQLPSDGVGIFSSVIVDPTGRFAYIHYLGTFFVFRIDQATGTLSPLTTLSNTGADSIKFDPSGRFAYLKPFSGTLLVYSVNQDTGELTSVASLGTNILNIAFDPFGRFAYVVEEGAKGPDANDYINYISTYDIDPVTGTFSLASRVIYEIFAPVGNSWIMSMAVDHTGHFVYTGESPWFDAENEVHEGGLPRDGGISVYSVNQATGALTKTSELDVGVPFDIVIAR